jgi:novobiocin biosynthesis protein NovU/D-mycarose 3-C-methyltransferase
MRTPRCRICLSRLPEPFLDLGATALANRFIHPDAAHEPEPRFPLRAVLCPACGLVQIDEEVPREVLFRDYIYVSGTSEGVRAHARFLASHFAGRCPLAQGDLVVEAASNDGTLLQAFRGQDVRVLGVEPALNIAVQARQAGIETLADFFDADLAQSIRETHGPARLFLARHVLAHVSDLHGFVEGIRRVLAPDGLAALEMPHLLTLHAQLAYDTIYHEHLCYFSVRVLRTLVEQFGLEIVDVHEVALHGGSILVTVQHQGGPREATAAVSRILQREEQAGLHHLELWQRFARGVADSRAALRGEIERLRRGGVRLAGYGAPAKGMTLLAACGLGREHLPYLVDLSPNKQGYLTPGHHIPVHAPAQLLQDRPDVVLLLAWNFADEIVRQQGDYLRRGGRFLVPIPLAHYRDAGRAGRLAA